MYPSTRKILRIPPFVTHPNKNNAQQRVTKERRLSIREGEEPKLYADEMLDTSTCPAVGPDPKKRSSTPIILPHFWIICTKIWMRAESSTLEGFSTTFRHLGNTWHPRSAQIRRCCPSSPSMLLKDHIMMNRGARMLNKTRVGGESKQCSAFGYHHIIYDCSVSTHAFFGNTLYSVCMNVCVYMHACLSK